MFICDFCKQSSELGEKLTRVVTQTREVRNQERKDDTMRSEIAQERNACPRCVEPSKVPSNNANFSKLYNQQETQQ